MSEREPVELDILLTAHASGDTDGTDAERVRQWVADDEGARAELADIEHIVAAVRRLEPRRSPEPNWDEMAADISRRIGDQPAAARRRWTPRRVAMASTLLAAAAALLLWWNSDREPRPPSEPAPVAQKARHADSPSGGPADLPAPDADADAELFTGDGDFLDETATLGGAWVADWSELDGLENASDQEVEAVLAALDAFPG